MMRNNIFSLIMMSVVVFFASCESDIVQYDPNGGQTLINFGFTSGNLQVVVDDEGSLTVPINVSTVSDVDRTFDVQVVTEDTELPAAAYSVPGTVTIPANSYSGEIEIDVIDIDVEIEPKDLVLSFSTSEDVVSDDNLVISVFQICPVEEGTFLGDYTVTIITPGVFGAGTYGSDGSTVTIRQGENELDRVFTANYFEDARFPRDFEFTLVCNTVVVPYQDQLVGCGGNSVNLSTGPPPVGSIGTFNSADDSEFTIILTDNVDSDCGGGPVVAEYRFTKQ